MTNEKRIAIARTRRIKLVRMQKSGLSLAEIGRKQVPPISKQRVKQIIERGA